jgi:hypothetical protein
VTANLLSFLVGEAWSGLGEAWFSLGEAWHAWR